MLLAKTVLNPLLYSFFLLIKLIRIVLSLSSLSGARLAPGSLKQVFVMFVAFYDNLKLKRLNHLMSKQHH